MGHVLTDRYGWIAIIHSGKVSPMPAVQRTIVTLRFSGDDLSPQELTDRLGGTPTLARTKGEEIHAKSGVRLAKMGQWHFSMESEAPDDFETLVRSLFAALSSDLSIWRDYSGRYAGNLFVGLFMGCSNEGVEIDPECLEAIAQRGLALGFDIYDPVKD